MKKISAAILFLCTLSLWAQDQSHRFIEWGFDVDASFANSYLGTRDIMQETVTLDLSNISSELKNGFGVFFDTHGRTFLNVNLGVNWGVGVFAGVDAMGQFKIPQSLMELLTKGNSRKETYADNFGLGAASFLETGFWTSSRFRRIKFTVQPAYFVPLAYLGKPTVKYSFSAKDDGTLSVSGKYKAELYTPFSLDDTSNIDVGSILSKGGVDITLRGEYPLSHNLILGGTITHVPFFPAQLSDKYSLSGVFNFTAEDIEHVMDIMNDDDDDGAPEFETNDEYGTSQKVIFRPFKVGVDMVYRPFNVRLLTIKPALALVFNSIYDTPIYADLGVIGELNLADIFIFDVGLHYEDLLWKERLGFTLNFRIIEIGIGVTTQSQEFLESFQGAGFGVDIGFRMGF
ncbi:hypothetical protein [Treponema primitia]|uniref:hypothetical protein n=1 Tax=Treponema primitia TaxID=88058 RepID=UPI0002555572|nr:hypothetical protein [Treponema primitia]